jgi:hypothetical protein
VYKIITDVNPEIMYIGSTTQTLSKRMAAHRSVFKKWNVDNPNVRVTSIFPFFLEYGLENFKIVEIERYEIEDIQMLRKYEQEHIELNPNCVNKIRAFGSLIDKNYYKEKHREWYNKNREVVSEKAKDYYIINRDKILKQKKEINKDYYKKNKDYYIEHNKNYYEKNKDFLKEKSKNNYKKNKEKLSQKVICQQCQKEMNKSSLSGHLKFTCKL